MMPCLEDGEEPWPFIIAFSLLLSGIFYRDKTLKGGAPDIRETLGDKMCSC